MRLTKTDAVMAIFQTATQPLTTEEVADLMNKQKFGNYTYWSSAHISGIISNQVQKGTVSKIVYAPRRCKYYLSKREKPVSCQVNPFIA